MKLQISCFENKKIGTVNWGVFAPFSTFTTCIFYTFLQIVMFISLKQGCGLVLLVLKHFPIPGLKGYIFFKKISDHKVKPKTG